MFKKSQLTAAIVAAILTGLSSAPAWAVKTAHCPKEMRLVFGPFQVNEELVSELDEYIREQVMPSVQRARRMNRVEVRFKMEKVATPGVCQYFSVPRGAADAILRTKGGRHTLQTFFNREGLVELIVYTPIADYSEEGLTIRRASSLYAPWDHSGERTLYERIGRVGFVAPVLRVEGIKDIEKRMDMSGFMEKKALEAGQLTAQ